MMHVLPTRQDQEENVDGGRTLRNFGMTGFLLPVVRQKE